MDTKAALRVRLVTQRSRRDTSALAAAGTAIAAHAPAAWLDEPVVAAYVAVGPEPPTQPLLHRLRSAGVRILLPIVAPDRRLDWAAYDGEEAMRPGPIGLMEPAGERLGPAAVTTAGVVVVPGLAVDRAGHRLGRGAGYYDRALADVAPERIVAVVFDDEVLDEVPAEPHDRPVGWALTPAGLLRLGPAR